MRYFEFLRDIKDISTSHILVNEYGEGDIYEYLNNGEHKYPCVFLTVTNLTTTDSGTAINFTLFYTDRLVENQANKTSIQSTGISVIKQILSRYEQLHPEYLLSNVNYTPFTEKFTDMCAGVFCDVVIENQTDTLENYDNECEEGAFAVKTITLTKNGVYDIVGYDSAVVLVEGEDVKLESITITENGVYVPEEGGYNEVVVDVESDCSELEAIVEELNTAIEEKDDTIADLQQTIKNKNGYILDLQEVNTVLQQSFDDERVKSYQLQQQINSVTSLTITENGTYTPPTDVLGYDRISVAVAGSGNVNKLKVEHIKITDNCLENGTWVNSEDLFNNIDKTYLTDFSEMFSNCKTLKSLDLSGLNTSNVTNMFAMFGGCNTLQSLNLSGWDTSNVTSMGKMFMNCNNLYSLNLLGWDTSNVTSMYYMFYNCDHPLFQTLDLSGWDTSNVTSMERMFSQSAGIKSLNLSGWNINEEAVLDYMFENSSVTTLDLIGWKFLGGGALTEGMFDCNGITSLIGGKNINEVLSKNISTFIDFGVTISLSLLKLDRASLRAFINGIADLTKKTTQTIYLGSTQLAKLTNEDIAIATAKNWTIA